MTYFFMQNQAKNRPLISFSSQMFYNQLLDCFFLNMITLLILILFDIWKDFGGKIHLGVISRGNSLKGGCDYGNSPRGFAGGIFLEPKEAVILKNCDNKIYKNNIYVINQIIKNLFHSHGKTPTPITLNFSYSKKAPLLIRRFSLKATLLLLLIWIILRTCQTRLMFWDRSTILFNCFPS